MSALHSMVYVSSGNVPSRWASTGQAAKMAEAFSRRLERFTFVIPGDLLSLVQGRRTDLSEWYGLHHAVKVVRVPIALKLGTPLPQDFRSDRFFTLSVLYAAWTSPSVVYTRSTDILRLCLNTGLPVLWEKHELVPDGALLRRASSRSNFLGLVTTSSELAHMYFAEGVPPHKTFVAPNAVDPDMFEPHQTKHAARRSLSLPTDAALVVYSGHLYDYKGIPTILEVARMMPHVHFVLVGGWDADVARVRDICTRERCSNVLVVGHVPQAKVTPYLYAADVLLLPTSSTWEQAAITCPLKLFDYMAAGRPIVAAALPVISTLLKDGRNARLARPDDAGSFEQAIASLLADRCSADELAAQALQDVRSHSWDNRARQVLEFARSPAAGGPARPAAFQPCGRD